LPQGLLAARKLGWGLFVVSFFVPLIVTSSSRAPIPHITAHRLSHILVDSHHHLKDIVRGRDPPALHRLPEPRGLFS